MSRFAASVLTLGAYGSLDLWVLLLIPALAVSWAVAKVAYEAIVRIGRLLIWKLEVKILERDATPPKGLKPKL